MREQETIQALSLYRLDQAKQCLQSAKLLYLANDFKSAANRSYYCIFHCMRAVLATKMFDSKKHSGIISEFRKSYIKTGIFDAKCSNIIGNSFDLRGASDYDDFYIVEKSAIDKQMENAETFLQAVDKYLNEIVFAQGGT